MGQPPVSTKKVTKKHLILDYDLSKFSKNNNLTIDIVYNKSDIECIYLNNQGFSVIDIVDIETIMEKFSENLSNIFLDDYDFLEDEKNQLTRFIVESSLKKQLELDMKDILLQFRPLGEKTPNSPDS